VGPFLPGPAAVAIKARAAIVPVHIEGAYRSWPRHRMLPGPAPVSIRYGQPLQPEELARYTPPALAGALHERVVALGFEEARLGRKPSTVPGQARAQRRAGA
jgi:1-acyl-sn-glycerol-3-phosphate acyltransferase